MAANRILRWDKKRSNRKLRLRRAALHSAITARPAERRESNDSQWLDGNSPPGDERTGSVSVGLIVRSSDASEGGSTTSLAFGIRGSIGGPFGSGDRPVPTSGSSDCCDSKCWGNLTRRKLGACRPVEALLLSRLHQLAQASPAPPSVQLVRNDTASRISASYPTRFAFPVCGRGSYLGKHFETSRRVPRSTERSRAAAGGVQTR